MGKYHDICAQLDSYDRLTYALGSSHHENEGTSIFKSQNQVDATVIPRDYHTFTTLDFNASLMKEAFDSPLSIAQQEVSCNDVGITRHHFALF